LPSPVRPRAWKVWPAWTVPTASPRVEAAARRFRFERATYLPLILVIGAASTLFETRMPLLV